MVYINRVIELNDMYNALYTKFINDKTDIGRVLVSICHDDKESSMIVIWADISCTLVLEDISASKGEFSIKVSMDGVSDSQYRNTYLAFLHFMAVVDKALSLPIDKV